MSHRFFFLLLFFLCWRCCSCSPSAVVSLISIRLFWCGRCRRDVVMTSYVFHTHSRCIARKATHRRPSSIAEAAHDCSARNEWHHKRTGQEPQSRTHNMHSFRMHKACRRLFGFHVACCCCCCCGNRCFLSVFHSLRCAKHTFAHRSD